MPEGAELGEFLLERGMISDGGLCKALSLQSGVPAAYVDVREVKQRVVRSLPAHVERRFGLLPYGVKAGKLLVAGARVPPSGAFEELKSFTQLQVEFQLVTRENYAELRQLLS
jgi:hypothetical protein